MAAAHGGIFAVGTSISLYFVGVTSSFSVFGIVAVTQANKIVQKVEASLAMSTGKDDTKVKLEAIKENFTYMKGFVLQRIVQQVILNSAFAFWPWLRSKVCYLVPFIAIVQNVILFLMAVKGIPMKL